MTGRAGEVLSQIEDGQLGLQLKRLTSDEVDQLVRRFGATAAWFKVAESGGARAAARNAAGDLVLILAIAPTDLETD